MGLPENGGHHVWKKTGNALLLCEPSLGAGHYQKLRFVFVEYDSTESILGNGVHNGHRGILQEIPDMETTFREFKQQIGGLSYHFWTKAMPHLSHYRKMSDPDPL